MSLALIYAIRVFSVAASHSLPPVTLAYAISVPMPTFLYKASLPSLFPIYCYLEFLEDAVAVGYHPPFFSTTSSRLSPPSLHHPSSFWCPPFLSSTPSVTPSVFPLYNTYCYSAWQDKSPIGTASEATVAAVYLVLTFSSLPPSLLLFSSPTTNNFLRSHTLCAQSLQCLRTFCFGLPLSPSLKFGQVKRSCSLCCSALSAFPSRPSRSSRKTSP